MIREKTLLDMGFILGHGWDHKVYVHDTGFWVHYNSEPNPNLKECSVSGKLSMPEFFKVFLDYIEHSAMERAL